MSQDTTQHFLPLQPPSPSRLKLILGDITTLEVDALVVPCNGSLLEGGRVFTQVHAVAGPELMLAAFLEGDCDIGEARLTPGFNLLARHVIHAVGPLWRGGRRSEDKFLAATYRNCLLLAEQEQLRSLAIPAISTGSKGFPLDRAAHIAIRTILEFLHDFTLPERVHLVCFDPKAYGIHQQALKEVRPL
jgi:O-acetyl-ADP-ribose deacetylase (regulator of RNase III)